MVYEFFSIQKKLIYVFIYININQKKGRNLYKYLMIERVQKLRDV